MNRREFLRIGGMSMMALVLGGCGLSSLTGESSGGQAGSSAAAGTAASSSSGTAEAAGGKTLVVYYSATGRTERVAEVIARERGADIMKLVPSPDYTEADLDYNDASSRVSREHDDASLREKIQLQKAVPDNWASYDTVFIGYPIWWNLAPRIIDTFIETHHLAGKTLIPFATSGGSGITNSVGALKKAYPDLNWKEGKLLNRMDENGIREWIGKTSKD